MKDLVKQMAGKPLVDESAVSFSDMIKKLLDFLQINSYIDEESVQAFALGRYLKELGQAIEDEAKENALDYLKSNEMNMDVGGINVSYREYKTKIYPDDEQLRKYEELLKAKEQEVKELKQSVKNRKATLEAEGKVVEMDDKATVTGRMR